MGRRRARGRCARASRPCACAFRVRYPACRGPTTQCRARDGRGRGTRGDWRARGSARPHPHHRRRRPRRRRRRGDAAGERPSSRWAGLPRLGHPRCGLRIRSAGSRRARRRHRALSRRRHARRRRAGAVPPAVRRRHGQALLRRARRGRSARPPDPALHRPGRRRRCARVAGPAWRGRPAASTGRRGAGCAPRRPDERVAPLGSRRSCRSEPPRVLHPPVRDPARRRGVGAASTVAASRSGDRGCGARLPLRPGRDRRGVDAQASLLRAEARGGEQLHELLPRHVVLLRSVDLCASPRPRARHPGRRAAPRAGGGPDRCRAHGSGLDGPLLLLLAVGDGRARRRDGPRDGRRRRSPYASPDRDRLGSGAGARLRRLRHARPRSLGRSPAERALDPGQRHLGRGREASACRRRTRLEHGREPRGDRRTALRAAQDLAHGAAHRRGRARRRGNPPLRRLSRRRGVALLGAAQAGRGTRVGIAGRPRRLLRGPVALGRGGRRRRRRPRTRAARWVPFLPAVARRIGRRTGRPLVQARRVSSAEGYAGNGLPRRDLWLLLGALGVLVLVTVPSLGAEPWNFRPGAVDPTGPFAAFVRGADGAWDTEAVRAPALLAGLVVALAAAAAPFRAAWPRWLAVGVTAAVVCLLAVPAVVLQAGLRQSSAPWFFTNDSTYQIELAGDLLRDGENPYGHDYSRSGLERFYSLDGSVSERTRDEQVALRHFAYFPGTALTAAAWSALPKPWSDYRFFVLLTTLAGLAASLLFPGPLVRRLVLGAVVAGSP